MAYATTDDVRRLMAQFPLASTSKPNDVEVATIVADIEHEVNVALHSRHITVPYAEVDEFSGWLGLVVSYGATATVLKSMFPGAAGQDSPAAFWESRYRAALKGINDGSLLPDDIVGVRARVATYFTRNPTSDEYLGDNAEPWFRRQRSW